MSKNGRRIFQPLVKERSPQGKVLVFDLYSQFSSVASQLHEENTRDYNWMQSDWVSQSGNQHKKFG